MKLRKVLTAVLAITMGLSLVACSPSSSESSPSAAPTENSADAPAEDTTANVDADAAANDGDIFNIANYKTDKPESEWTIAVVTKDNTAAWFQRMEQGIEEFKEATGINVIQKGPATPDAASQVQVIDDLINQGVDALCVVPIDPGALEASLENAMNQGIVVVTHESSPQVNTLFDVEAFTAEDFGAALMDSLAAEMNKQGKYGIMVAFTTTATHMGYGTAAMEHQVATYPDMELIGGTVPTAESEESIDTAYERAKEILKANPDLGGFIGCASTDGPGIAKAVEEMGLNGQVKIVTVATPNEARNMVEAGTISRLKLWDPKDAGYAMCSLAKMILNGENVGEGSNLGVAGYESVTLVEGTNRTLVGKADIEMTKENIANYDF